MRLIILGAGGHGRVVADIAEQTGKYDKISFLDDNSNADDVVGKCDDYINFAKGDIEIYPAFGNNEARIKWENKLVEEGFYLAKIIHPTAYVSPSAEVESGSVIMPKAIVNTGTVIKKACIVNIGAIIDHNCVLEEGCHIAPGGIVKGDNHLPEGTKVDSGEVIPLRYYEDK